MDTLGIEELVATKRDEIVKRLGLGPQSADDESKAEDVAGVSVKELAGLDRLEQQLARRRQFDRLCELTTLGEGKVRRRSSSAKKGSR